MYEYPKLRIPLIALVLAALFVAITLKAKDLPDWLRLFVAIMAIIFGVTGVITLMDWVGHNFSERLKEINTARTWGAVSLARALQGLSAAQTEAVFAGEKIAMQMMPSNDEPMLYVRGLTRSIPWDFVDEFLRRSEMTYPYLWPVRESSNEAFATDLTNLIVSRGWADKSVGPFSAKLAKPLGWVARRFWVDLESPEYIEVDDESEDPQ